MYSRRSPGKQAGPACRCASTSRRGADDSLAGWLEAYFAVEVTTAQSSRAVQRRDLTRFLRFMQAEEGSDDRSRWTSRLSRAFIDDLRSELDSGGGRYFSDRTIARMAAHLKTFAKWIHRLRPFRMGDPTEKLKGMAAGPGLEIERALTESERRKLLDAADHLPVLGRPLQRPPPLRRTSSSPTSVPAGRATVRGATGRSSTP